MGELLHKWSHLRRAERVKVPRLPRELSDDFFLDLGAKSQAHFALDLPRRGAQALYPDCWRKTMLLTFASEAQGRAFKDAFALCQAGSVPQAQDLLLAAINKSSPSLTWRKVSC